MTGYDHPGVGADVTSGVYRRLDELDATMRESMERMEKARSMADLLADVTGTATSEDGYITVESKAGSVTDLVINPRAMKLGSEDLAAAIRETIDAAAVDYREKTLTALRDAGLMPSPEQQQRDLDAATRQLGAAQQELQRSLREATSAVGTASRIRQQGLK